MTKPVEMDELWKVARKLGSEWNVKLGAELPGAMCSLIAAGVDEHGREVVLKVPQPHAEEKEAYPVLRAFSGHGGVEVMRVDEPSGAVLMPRLRPGQMLADSDLTDLEQVDLCAAAILRLRSAPLVPAISMERWLKELYEAPDKELVIEAKRLGRYLLDTTTATTLLHGDLHHYNILSHGDEWKVIDPKGIVGDPSFEMVGFMRNPWQGPHTPEKMESRLRRFQEKLGDDPFRLWAWSFVQTVLCSIQDEAGDKDMREAAQALWAIKGGVTFPADL